MPDSVFIEKLSLILLKSRNKGYFLVFAQNSFSKFGDLSNR